MQQKLKNLCFFLETYFIKDKKFLYNLPYNFTSS